MKLVMIHKGACRAYSRSESGTLSIIHVGVVNGKPVDYLGTPYDTNNPVVPLIGWPDTKAIEATPNLLIAIR